MPTSSENLTPTLDYPPVNFRRNTVSDLLKPAYSRIYFRAIMEQSEHLMLRTVPGMSMSGLNFFPITFKEIYYLDISK